MRGPPTDKIWSLGTAIFLLATAVGAGEPPPTTIITHGYQFAASVPNWVFILADAIARRAAIETGIEGGVYVYRRTDGELLPCAQPWCTTDGPGHSVLVFDWADDSNESGAGFSEAAAEALFAGLVDWSRREPPLVDLDRLHFIGHSRGAVVNSEVVERLIAAALPPPLQVTSLDPHDAGIELSATEAPEGGLDDYDVNREHPEYNCHAGSPTPGVCAWEGGGYHDNYWQNDTGCVLFDPNGLELFGASNFNQNALDSPFCHSDTHLWYFFTTDLAAVEHPGTGAPPGPDWFGTESVCSTSPRSAPLARIADGYNASDAAGGSALRCPGGPGSRQPVGFDWNLAEGLVNGDFERTRGGGRPEPGWSFHGGHLQGSIGSDGDHHLVLGAGGSATHNRFYLPEHSLAIEICSRIVGVSATDRLSFTLKVPGREDRELLTAAQQDLSALTEWQCYEAPVDIEETGRSVQVQLSLTALESPAVWIDDIGLSVGIFVDDFETGDSRRWSSIVP